MNIYIWQYLNTKIHLHPCHSQTGVSCSQLLRINSRSNAFLVLYIYAICNFLYKLLWMNHNSYGCMHGHLQGCTYIHVYKLHINLRTQCFVLLQIWSKNSGELLVLAWLQDQLASEIPLSWRWVAKCQEAWVQWKYHNTHWYRHICMYLLLNSIIM